MRRPRGQSPHGLFWSAPTSRRLGLATQKLGGITGRGTTLHFPVFEIGNSLREARLRQGLDFPEIEQATKIRGKYLRSLEEEQFEVLPAQTYVKGFLRSYADYLGLDGQLYVDEFNSRYVRGELEEEEKPFRPTGGSLAGRSSSFQGKAVMLTVAVIAGLTVFVFAAFERGANPPSDIVLNNNPPPPAKSRHKPMARLAVSGVGGGAYVAIYRGSRTSKPIYQGTLEGGRRHTFVGRHLWIYVFAPANLRLRLNGKTRVVPGRGQGSRRWLEVTPKRISLAPSLA